MKLKRYTAPDIRQAMAKVREELGPDAVILSNRKIDSGIEIIAAMDYDDAIVQTPLMTKKEKAENASKASLQQSKLQQQHSSHNTSPNTTPTSRNESLAEHLSKTNLGSNVETPAPKSNWKKAFEETYDAEQNDRSMEFEERRSVKRSEIASQVSSEWVDQFKTDIESRNETEVNKQVSPSEKVNKENDSDELKNVWDELSSLRGLLETQLSSLAWNDASKRNPTKAKVLKHLLELGLTPDISYELLAEIDDSESFESCWRKSLAKFVRKIPVVEEDIIKDGGIFALVGPTGVGKTTTIAKLAARYALIHGADSIALVTTDNYRIGAQEQLRTYGRILGTPVKIANNAEELRNVLKSLYEKQLILIDTAGMSQRDIKLTEQFSMLSEGSILIKSYLVVSASSQQQVLDETVQAYKKAFLDGCIITKLDETLSLGGALSTIAKHKLPITYISDGQRVPEDLQQASPIELVKSSVSMMNRAKIQIDENVVELAYGGLAANDLS